MHFGIPRNERFANIFQYDLHSPRCAFSIAVPVWITFKIEVVILVPHVLIYCIYDTIIVSRNTYHEGWFLASVTDRRQKGLNLENTGDEERLRSRIQSAAATATCDVWAGVLSCKSRTPRVNFPLLFLTISWRSRSSVLLHDMHRLSYNLTQDNQTWLLPDYS